MGHSYKKWTLDLKSLTSKLNIQFLFRLPLLDRVEQKNLETAAIATATTAMVGEAAEAETGVNYSKGLDGVNRNNNKKINKGKAED